MTSIKAIFFQAIYILEVSLACSQTKDVNDTSFLE